MNVLLALRQRDRSGQGCHLDIAMTDAMFTFASHALAFGHVTGEFPGMGGERLTGGSPRYQIYPTKDGKFVCCAALEQRFWEPFTATIGLARDFVDDRRDPKERVTIIADHGTVLKNESGSYLVLEDGNLERFEAGKRDPALVAFARYAFDMSKFSNRGRDVALGIRERYLWELVSPPDDDPVFKQLTGQFRAELHDRFLAPVYPFAFAVLTFAFLGTPRTTRQSRNFSIGGSILAVFGLRMAGFACSVMTVKTPEMAIVQYLMLFSAIGIGLWMIIGGIVVEPPAALMEAINRSNARLARLFGRPATA